MTDQVDIDAQLERGAALQTGCWTRDRRREGRVRPRTEGHADRGRRLLVRLPAADVLSKLEDLGWDIEAVAHFGDTVESMAYDEAQQRGLKRAFLKVSERGDTPGVASFRRRERLRRTRAGDAARSRGQRPPPINETITDELVNVRMVAAWAALIGFTSTLAEGCSARRSRPSSTATTTRSPTGGGSWAARAPAGTLACRRVRRKGIDPMRTARISRGSLLDRTTRCSSTSPPARASSTSPTSTSGTLDSVGYKDDWANELTLRTRLRAGCGQDRRGAS